MNEIVLPLFQGHISGPATGGFLRSGPLGSQRAMKTIGQLPQVGACECCVRLAHMVPTQVSGTVFSGCLPSRLCSELTPQSSHDILIFLSSVASRPPGFSPRLSFSPAPSPCFQAPRALRWSPQAMADTVPHHRSSPARRSSLGPYPLTAPRSSASCSSTRRQRLPGSPGTALPAPTQRKDTLLAWTTRPA